jgi:hypothetical protein
MATVETCLDALREAAARFGESPTKAQYDASGFNPSSTTIVRLVGSWNEAKEQAGLETYTQAESGGTAVESKPEWLELPTEDDWGELTSQQRWYYKNRENRIQQKEERRRSLRRWFTGHKQNNYDCERCGESRPECLDFHHTGEKTLDVTRMVNHGYSKERILSEIGRCTPICANCHRKLHAEDYPTQRTDSEPPLDRRMLVLRRKQEPGGCNRCDATDPRCLDFHHPDGKAAGIARMVADTQPREAIRRELDRCELLCANCHRREHHADGD